MQSVDTLVQRTTRNYVIALVLIGLLAASGVGVLQWHLAGVEDIPSTVNQAGRQRMLVQRAALLSTQLMHQAAPVGSNGTRVAVRRALRELRSTNRQLLSGFEGGGLGAHAAAHISGSSDSVQGAVEAYVEQVEAFLARLSRGQPVDMAAAHTRLAKAADRTTDTLDAFVNELERESRRGVMWLRALSWGLIAVITAALVGAGFGLFRPMTRRIAWEMGERAAADEALRQSNDELEAFVYSVAHDLRGPLRSIDGFSQALEEDAAETLDEDSKDYLARIRTATQRMGQLIDDLLQLSRINRAEMQHQDVDLSRVAEEVVAELRERDPARDVRVDIQPGLEAQGDPRLLRVVLDNLIGNAWKFTANEAEPEIEITGTRRGREEVYEVRDNGAGFDMAYADKLFRPFQRLHGSNEFPGTGIGLVTVARVIRRHCGRVWAESTPGEGTTMHFTLWSEERTS